MKQITLAAMQSIVCDEDGIDNLTKGRSYTILEDESQDGNWRIIRVTCDDGVARRVPPQMFRTPAGDLIGCRLCFDHGYVHGGQDQGEYIRRCECQRPYTC